MSGIRQRWGPFHPQPAPPLTWPSAARWATAALHFTGGNLAGSLQCCLVLLPLTSQDFCQFGKVADHDLGLQWKKGGVGLAAWAAHVCRLQPRLQRSKHVPRVACHHEDLLTSREG